MPTLAEMIEASKDRETNDARLPGDIRARQINMPTLAEMIEASKQRKESESRLPGDIPAREIDRWVLSVDLGKLSDNSAASLINHVVTGTGQWLDDVKKQRSREKELIVYRVLDLYKIPLKTPYATVARETREALKRIENTLGVKPRVVVDSTGVGNAALEFFDAEMLYPHRITITGGNELIKTDGRSWSVPKTLLVEHYEALVDARQVHVIGDTDAAKAFRDEVKNFERQLTSTGRPTWNAAQSHHDDLLLSVMQGCFYVANQRSSESWELRI
ncbi:hypothetical protein QA649_27950 [Bradyrhizobium sp. CB1717]|uniref:hypothetical protein n=1 Tax=Bradyrhizobium sp. CB1717 TaxID=3039154 RepID=UPI0024B04D1E|nr:hypothetical protein [Bradyrhizobium sp. CB1717]WFU21922.1 hypothetical protein QA649_27950 [Bradyrhizobium sp. CB1717]